MPKYYCDYCDTYLTHDSPSVRKTHNGGRKHKDSVRLYYMNWLEKEAQNMIDHTGMYRMGQIRPVAPGLLAPPGAMPPPGMMMPPPMGMPPRPGMMPMPMGVPPRPMQPPPGFPGMPMVPPGQAPPGQPPPGIPPPQSAVTAPSTAPGTPVSTPAVPPPGTQ